MPGARAALGEPLRRRRPLRHDAPLRRRGGDPARDPPRARAGRPRSTSARACGPRPARRTSGTWSPRWSSTGRSSRPSIPSTCAGRSRRRVRRRAAVHGGRPAGRRSTTRPAAFGLFGAWARIRAGRGRPETNTLIAAKPVARHRRRRCVARAHHGGRVAGGGERRRRRASRSRREHRPRLLACAHRVSLPGGHRERRAVRPCGRRACRAAPRRVCRTRCPPAASVAVDLRRARRAPRARRDPRRPRPRGDRVVLGAGSLRSRAWRCD